MPITFTLQCPSSARSRICSPSSNSPPGPTFKTGRAHEADVLDAGILSRPNCSQEVAYCRLLRGKGGFPSFGTLAHAIFFGTHRETTIRGSQSSITMIIFELSVFQMVFSSRVKGLTGRTTPPNATPMTRIRFIALQRLTSNTLPPLAPSHHLHHHHRISTLAHLIRVSTSTLPGRPCQGFRQLCP